MKQKILCTFRYQCSASILSVCVCVCTRTYAFKLWKNIQSSVNSASFGVVRLQIILIFIT